MPVSVHPGRVRGTTIRDAVTEALSWVLPVECAGCGNPDTPLCASCTQALAFVRARRRMLGGLPVLSALDYDSPVTGVMRALKADGRTTLARPLGAALQNLARVAQLAPDVLFVPVPTSREAFRRRGYRVVELLCARAGLPVHRVLSLTRSVADQRTLGRDERESNVAGAFRAHGCRGVPVVIIDDVVTTGATLRAARDALESVGARPVLALTVAATARRDEREETHVELTGDTWVAKV